MKKFLAVFIGVLFAACAAAAQSSDSATNTARAGIIQPLSLRHNTKLNFGTLIVPQNPTVYRHKGPGFVGMGTISGDPVYVSGGTYDSYAIVGQQGARIFTEVTPEIMLTSGANEIPVDLFLYGNMVGSPVYGDSNSVALPGLNAGNYNWSYMVGGDITLLPTTKPGAYTGTFTVTVSYQ